MVRTLAWAPDRGKGCGGVRAGHPARGLEARRMRRTLASSTVLSLLLTLVSAAVALADGGGSWHPR